MKSKYIAALVVVCFSALSLVVWLFYEGSGEEPVSLTKDGSLYSDTSSDETDNTYLDLPLEDLLNIVVLPEKSEVGNYDDHKNIVVWLK